MSDTETKTTEAVTTDDKPQGSPPDNAQGQQSGQDATEPTLTQAEANRLIGKARSEGRSSAEKALYEELGIDNLDSLKSLLEDYNKRKQADMSELEKAQAAIEAANKKAQEAEAAKQALEQQVLNGGRKQAFIEAVRKSGGTNAPRVYALLQFDNATAFDSVFDEGNTQADDAKMKALIKQVQSDYPEYFGTPGAGSPSAAQGIAPSVQQNIEKQTQNEVKKKFGKL